MGTQFVAATALAGDDFATFPDYPAEIRAPAGTTFGVSAYQIHLGARPITTAGDAPHVLVAFNPAALKVNLPLIADGALIVLSSLGQYAASERISYSLHRYELVIDGRVVETEMEEFNLRAYEAQEFQVLLERAGFVDVKVLKAFEQRAPDPDDEGLVFECRRP